MREVYIQYNPYTVKTKFVIDGENVDESSKFFEKQEGIRLQEWIEENDEWNGLFDELSSLMNYSGELKVIFHGTELDFLDVKEASEKYSYKFSNIEFEYISGSNNNDKLNDLQELYKELKNGPVEEVNTEKIRLNFEAAISSEFEVVIVAPMSSGKSTLINSMICKDLLPAVNQATTAVITRIKHDQSCKNFLVNCKDKKGNVVAKDEIATLEIVDKLNKRSKEIDEINIKGNIKNIHSNKINIVFVDTPGGNNSQDRDHERVMKEAISDEKKGMILFVFNYTQLETEDCDRILNYISQAMKNTSLGKQARDRFIFVCNKMDAQDIEREPYDEVIDKLISHLRKFDIKNPNIFLTCADAAKLIRMSYEDETLDGFSESEEDRFDGYLKPFNRPSRQLFKYASMSEVQKRKYQYEVEAIRESGEKKSTRAVEINSGIPILEEALRLYIEKYAVAIKVKNVHDTFMSKVNEQKMLAICRQSWVESEEKFYAIQEEVQRKKIEYNNNEKLKEFKEKIECINIDYKIIDRISEDILIEIREISSNYPESINKDEADTLVKKIERDLNSQLIKAKQKLENNFEDQFYAQCKNILQEFKSYIKDLERDGLLNIGEFNFKNLDDYNELELNDLVKEYAEEKIVGTENVKKKGVIGLFKRAFKIESGWEEQNVYGTVVNIKKLVRDKIGILSNDILNEIDNQIEETKNKEDKVKDEVNRKLSNIDTLIKEKFEELRMETANRDVLENKVKDNLEKYNWLEVFVDKMDKILEI